MEQEQKLTADQIIKFLEERNFKGIGKSASCGSCRCHGRTG